MDTVMKVIVDTDCGIDDAMALLLAFGNEAKFQVVAITCCHGNTALDNVCQNVKRVLNVCGKKNVPVYRGCAGALISGKRTASRKPVHGLDGFGNCSHLFSTGDIIESEIPAANALVQWTTKYPGEISLIVIGPLTNIVLAHRLDPQFTHRLKSMSIMGSTYQGIRSEMPTVADFNFLADPEAADIILGEAECPVILVPWEITRTYGIEWDTYDTLVGVQTVKGNLLRCITKYRADLLKKDHHKQFFDCDFLAAATLLYPETVSSSIERVLTVECKGTETRGFTVFLDTANPTAVGRKKIKIVTEFKSKDLDELRFQMLK